MSEQRSTFSESWHRVAKLRPRLSPAVKSTRQHVRGRLWYFLRDPWTLDTYRLHEAAYQFIGMLDGKRTIEVAWSHCNEELGDYALTQPEVIELLAWLHTSNLLQGDLPPDASQLFHRHQKRKRSERGKQMLSIMALRIPIFDPDAFLNRWTPLLGFAFSKLGFVLWAVLLVVGIAHVVGDVERLWVDARHLLSPSPLNLIMLYGSFVLLKLLHEVGHGVACKRFAHQSGDAGGVHSFGVMFLVFMPIPYVDVSSAWLLRNKWQRATIGAAGMYVELAVAAVAAVIWARTGPGLLHDVCYQMMFWASITTLLFNANPLLRFDGYYILLDVLEMPNLDMRSKGYVVYLIKRYLFGIRRVISPAHTRGELFWLPTFFVTAWIYRILLAWAIILYVATMFFTIGFLLVGFALIGWVIMPILAMLTYLATSPELEGRRLRAGLVTTVAIAPIATVLLLIPVADWSASQGVAEPVRFAMVFPREEGFVRSVAPTLTVIKGGADAVLVLGNEMLQLQRDAAALELAEAQTELRKAEAESAVEGERLRREIEVLSDRVAWYETRIGRLAVRPDVSGVWLCANWESLPGSFIDPMQSKPVGTIASLDEMQIRVAADQVAGPRISAESAAGQQVRVRPIGQPDHEFICRIERINPAGQKQLPSASLAASGGGNLETAIDSGDGLTAAEPVFEVIVVPIAQDDAPAPAILPGQRFEVRFDFQRAPLAVQWTRALYRLVQRRFQVQL